MEHPIFGEISYDQGWYKFISIEIFGAIQEIEVVIDAEENGEFFDYQIAAYQKFFKDIGEQVKKIEEAVYNYYNENKSNFNLDTPSFSRIEKIDDMKKLVKFEQIVIPLFMEENTREVGVLGECVWEEEHGIGIKFIDETVVDVGFQDIVL